MHGVERLADVDVEVGGWCLSARPHSHRRFVTRGAVDEWGQVDEELPFLTEHSVYQTGNTPLCWHLRQLSS